MATTSLWWQTGPSRLHGRGRLPHAPGLLALFRGPRGLRERRHRRAYIRRRAAHRVERLRAQAAQLARPALGAAPHAVIDILHLIEQRAVVGHHAELEVATPRAARAQPGAGPV